MTEELEIDYALMVQRNAKAGYEIRNELTASNANLWHMATGVSGEAGELLDAVKKAAVYGRPVDRVNLLEELGDIEFYLEGLRAALGFRRDEVLKFNIMKLEKRYESGRYSNAEAIGRRDKTEEND